MNFIHFVYCMLKPIESLVQRNIGVLSIFLLFSYLLTIANETPTTVSSLLAMLFNGAVLLTMTLVFAASLFCYFYERKHT